MKKQIKLTLLGVLLFASAAIYADDTEKGQETAPKTNIVKEFISKSGTVLKNVATNRYVQVGTVLVAAVAVGCYVYSKVTAQEKATTLLV